MNCLRYGEAGGAYRGELTLIVLDASAALAYLLSEPGGALVRGSLTSSVMTSVNLIEVMKRLRKDLAEMKAAEVFSVFTAKLQSVEDVKGSDVFLASKIYTDYQKSHNISLGDAVCLAVGLRLKAEVWTAEKVWASLPNVGQVRVIR